MTEIINQNRTAKKFVVPVIMLILLGTSLVGSAYAYSSSVMTGGNAVLTDYLAIDLRTGDASTDLIPVDNNGALVFTDHYVYSGSSKQDRVDAVVTTKKIMTCNLKVSSDTDWNTIKVTSSDIATLLARSVDGVTFGTAFKLYVNVNTDSMTGAQELKASGTGEATFSVTKVSETDNVTAYIYMVAMNNGTPLTTLNSVHATTVRAQSAVAAQNDHNAAYYSNLFTTNDYKFTLSFHATYVAPAP